jgi:hypothetical protein
LLSLEENSPLQKVIDNNLVPKFIANLARDDFPQIQFESAWCITNIACGEHKFAQNLLDHGAIEALIKLLAAQNIEVIEQAIWALGNLAGDNVNIRNLIIQRGAVEPIAAIVSACPAGTSFCRNSAWALTNLCRGRPVPAFYLIKNAIIAMAKVLIENSKVDGFKTIIESNVVGRIIQLLEHQNLSISVPCLRTIGNLLTGSDEET